MSLNRDSYEFRYVAYKFIATFLGRNEQLNNISSAAIIVGQNSRKTDLAKVMKVEKVYNSRIYDRFVSELGAISKKHNGKEALSLLKHLFHGTSATPPSKIYSDEDGLDMRFSNNGLNGKGIYFADNSLYSHAGKYRHDINNNQHQMLMCLVITGESTSTGGGPNTTKPP